MYITDTTENVRKLIEELEQKDDVNKLKFLIYIFGLLNNNQINDKNEENPNLIEDEDMKIFTLELLGMSANANTVFLQYLVMLHNILTNSKEVYEDNGNVIGVKYSEDDKKIASQFEKLTFKEKLDIFKELFIRYDNDTYFEEKINILSFDSKLSGFDMAKLIDNYKEKM